MSWTPAVLTLWLLLAGVGVLVAIEVESRRLAADNRAEEARAEAALTRDAHAYADAVIAVGELAPTDERLAAVAGVNRVEVREVHRAPALSVVVYGTERYATTFGMATMLACHRVTFRDLGAGAARAAVERLPICPGAGSRPAPS
ncbi:hypothetical protein [Micromonospora sp. KC721]|uniref:hypothetical protein n=1 Tax=Micromonospora sp. KC721 TaxID=2530380 RepID=UPI0010508A98|nr:hypothetical protein [Micromonospora sp. KC721]